MTDEQTGILKTIDNQLKESDLIYSLAVSDQEGDTIYQLRSSTGMAEMGLTMNNLAALIVSNQNKLKYFKTIGEDEDTD